MKKYGMLKIFTGIFVILCAIVHGWFSYGITVIFGVMEGWVVNSTDAEKVWLGFGLLISVFLLVSGILVFCEKKPYVLAVCAVDIIYWLVPYIASMVPMNDLDGLSAFFRDDSLWFLLAFCIADAIGIILTIFLWRMRNKQKQYEVLSEDLEEGK